MKNWSVQLQVNLFWNFLWSCEYRTLGKSGRSCSCVCVTVVSVCILGLMATVMIKHSCWARCCTNVGWNMILSSKGLWSNSGQRGYLLKRNGIEARGKTDKGKINSSVCAQPKSWHNPLCYLLRFLRKRQTTCYSKQHTTESIIPWIQKKLSYICPYIAGLTWCFCNIFAWQQMMHIFLKDSS